MHLCSKNPNTFSLSKKPTCAAQCSFTSNRDIRQNVNGYNRNMNRINIGYFSRYSPGFVSRLSAIRARNVHKKCTRHRFPEYKRIWAPICSNNSVEHVRALYLYVNALIYDEIWKNQAAV